MGACGGGPGSKFPSRFEPRYMREARMLRESFLARRAGFDLPRDRLLDLGKLLGPADDVRRDRLRYHHESVTVADDEVPRRDGDAGGGLSGQRDRRFGAGEPPASGRIERGHVTAE